MTAGPGVISTPAWPKQLHWDFCNLYPPPPWGVLVKGCQRLHLPPQCPREAYFAAPCGPWREGYSVCISEKMYVLHELCLSSVSREEGLLSSSCGNWKGLIFPKLLKNTGQKCPEA